MDLPEYGISTHFLCRIRNKKGKNQLPLVAVDTLLGEESITVTQAARERAQRREKCQRLGSGGLSWRYPGP